MRNEGTEDENLAVIDPSEFSEDERPSKIQKVASDGFSTGGVDLLKEASGKQTLPAVNRSNVSKRTIGIKFKSK